MHEQCQVWASTCGGNTATIVDGFTRTIAMRLIILSNTKEVLLTANRDNNKRAGSRPLINAMLTELVIDTAIRNNLAKTGEQALFTHILMNLHISSQMQPQHHHHSAYGAKFCVHGIPRLRLPCILTPLASFLLFQPNPHHAVAGPLPACHPRCLVMLLTSDYVRATVYSRKCAPRISLGLLQLSFGHKQTWHGCLQLALRVASGGAFAFSFLPERD